MTTLRTLIAASMLCSLPAAGVWGQASRTGTGGGPLSTEKPPNTTAVGQTKPPNRDASPASLKPIERPTPRQAADDAIGTKVCTGCGGEPGTTGALSLRATAVDAQAQSDVQLDELRAAAEPRKQVDLDTVALASARRERAESVQEKTNGLWQSWLVSVCEGCGDQKPAKILRLEDWAPRNAPTTTGSVDRKYPSDAHRPSNAKQVAAHHHGDLVADLSPENVDSIRRMPRH